MPQIMEEIVEVFSGPKEPQFMAVFLAFRRLDGVFVLFSPSSGRPGVSASFSSPRALTPVSARGLLPISFELLSGSFMCGQTHMLMTTTTTIRQSGEAPF